MTVSTRRSLGPFETVRELTYDAPFPALTPVRQRLVDDAVSDVAAATRAALQPLCSRVRAGMSIAVTAGSRGIADLPTVLRAAGEELRACGAEPFIVPAMGSHGGATAEGQTALLAHLGVTEQSMGMPVRATMDTVELGRLPGGPEVHLDANAAAADGILVINRVKAHTDFTADIESGLAKITAIGLGKQRGARGVHAYGAARLGEWVPQMARRIIDTGKVLGGLALVENAYDRCACLEFLEPEDIGGPRETQLLADSKKLMATLPFDALDVLIVDAIGKDKSGTGLDTNVIGRMMIRGSEEYERPRIANIAVLDVTEASDGNANGLGLADFIPFRLLERIDLRAVYVNAVTSGNGGPQRAQIPIALPTDRDAIAAAILTCGRADLAGVRLARIRDTLDLGELQVSPALLAEVRERDDLDITGPEAPMPFDTDGVLARLP